MNPAPDSCWANFGSKWRLAGARRWVAFTLIEILLASVAAALLLSAVYAIFQGAVRMRDSGDRRVRAARLRLRAETVLREDLRDALISGGILANILSGDSAGTDTTNVANPHASNFPGYLKFTTTTGRDNSAELYGDVQQVEYYIIADPAAPSDIAQSGGILVRAITRDLLDAENNASAAVPGSAAAPREEQILTHVQSFQVSFFDGANWQTSWQFAGLTTNASGAAVSPSPSPGGSSVATLNGQTGLPDAIRVDIQQAAAGPHDPVPPPLEILVPWTTQPFGAATPATSTATAAASATPTPSATPAASLPKTPPKSSAPKH